MGRSPKQSGRLSRDASGNPPTKPGNARATAKRYARRALRRSNRALARGYEYKASRDEKKAAMDPQLS